MENRERDTWDDLFRSKLQDFEVDTLPEDWEAIADRLADKRIVPFRRTVRYWAAAVVALLMMTGSIYMYDRQGPVETLTDLETSKMERPAAVKALPAEEAVTVVESLPAERHVLAATTRPPGGKNKARKTVSHLLQTEDLRKETVTEADVKDMETVTSESETQVVTRSLQKEEQKADEAIDATPEEGKKRKNHTRKWSFGMGGGSVSAGSDNALNTYAFKNTTHQDLELLSLNSPYFDRQAAKTEIHHKTPVTVGVSVSRYLNNRFSLQSGITYTFLCSEWETNGMYRNSTKQKLHFIGIPLSLSYRIAEWQKIQFYAVAGGMMEINVAGRLDTKRYSEGKVFKHQREKTRMDDLLWSVNARVGAGYPVFRFLSLYAEAGVGYYFDNHSPIETIRSEKPFNVSLQAGFRFGF